MLADVAKYIKMILFVVIVACVYGAPNPEAPEGTTSVAAKYISEALQSIRPQIPDPLPIDKFKYSVNNSPGIFSIDMDLTEPVIKGLSDFQVTSVTPDDDDPKKLTLKLFYNSIHMKASYSMRGAMLGFFPLSSFGNMELEASFANLIGKANVEGNNKLILSDLRVNFTEPQVEARFRDSISGDLKSVTIELLDALGGQIFKTSLRPILSNILNTQLKKFVNLKLSTIDTSSVQV